MIALLGLISLVCIFVFIVMLIVNAVKNKPLKVSILGFVISVVVFFLCMILTPSSDTSKVFDENEINQTKNDVSSEHVVTEASSADVKMLTEEYLYESDYATYYFVAVTNNTNNVYEIGGNGVAFNKEGSLIGADDICIDVLGPGETSIAYFYFENVSGVDHVEYQMTYKNSYYNPVLKDISTEETINDKNVIISATNNGDRAAEFVEAYALFFDENNNVVYYSSNYITDNDSEIKPGATLYEQIESYKSFDHVKVYYTGRRH